MQENLVIVESPAKAKTIEKILGKDAYVYTQHIGLSLSYNFNTTRSKYKGTGAGNAEKNRL